MKYYYLVGFLLVFLSCNQVSKYSIDPKDDITIGSVSSYAFKNWIETSPVFVESKEYNGFDFYSLKPINDLNESLGKMTVFYNGDREIVMIRNYGEYEGDDLEFRFSYNRSQNYAVMYGVCQDFDCRGDGFFIFYNDKCYFISLDESGCTMLLDKNLKVVETLRFVNGRLSFKTIVGYVNDNHLCSETFLVPNEGFLLSSETLLDELFSKIDDNDGYTFEKRLKLGLIREWDQRPLWLSNGRHEHDYSAKEPFDCIK